MRAGALVRRHRTATVLLALLAGLAAAVPMAMWAAGRRTADAVDTFIASADSADLLIEVCPAGVVPDSPAQLELCLGYVPTSELATIRSMPQVAAAARASWTVMRLGDDPAGPFRTATMVQVDGAEVPTALGTPVVVSGRLPDLHAPDEIVVSDGSARSLGIEPGHRVWMSGMSEDAVPFPSTVVGVVRTAGELVPEQTDSPLSSGNPMLHAASGWSRAHGDDVERVSNSIGVFLASGTPEQFIAELQARLPELLFDASAALDSQVIETSRQATAYEARAASGIAVGAAVVAAFLVGQAIGRQSRRESDDNRVLLALGISRRDIVASSIARWTVTAVLAALVSAAAVIAASALGPVGIGRRAPWSREIVVDPVVLAVGIPAVALLVLVAGVLPSMRRTTSRSLGVAVSVPGPPAISAGVMLALRGVRRGAGVPILSAVVGIAVAVAMLIGAFAGSATMADVTADPVRYGADFDAIVGLFGEASESADLRRAVPAHPDVEAAAELSGMNVMTERGELWVQSFLAIDGVEPVRPVITSGREPTRDDEIALGTVAMDELALEVGDELELRAQAGNGPPRQFEVVGTTMVTDNYEPRVGSGGILHPDGLANIAPGASSGGIAVRVADADRDGALARLRRDFPDQFTPVVLPASLQNVERVMGIPFVIGAITAALAAATLTHALLMCVRRQRRELAVYKSLGFTRRQVIGAVTTEATLLGALALAIGVPLGLIVARWGWRVFARGLGLAGEASIPVGVVAASVLGVLVVANLAAAVPGWRAGRIPAADALRTE
jgi:ABC-type lipoprotein release transport system permease subunit